jgi:hypothetical protein
MGFVGVSPVGGMMCAASPAGNSHPKGIGSATKLRSGAQSGNGFPAVSGMNHGTTRPRM